MPFIASIHHNNAPHQQKPRAATAATDFSNIAVPVKPMDSGAIITTKSRDNGHHHIMDTLCAAIPHIRYDGVSMGGGGIQGQGRNALLEPPMGGIAGLPPHLLMDDACPPPPPRPEGSGGAFPHPHCGVGWQHEAADVMSTIQMHHHQARCGAAEDVMGSGTPVANFMCGALAHPPSSDDTARSITNTVAAKHQQHGCIVATIEEDMAQGSAVLEAAMGTTMNNSAGDAATMQLTAPAAVPTATPTHQAALSPAVTKASPLDVYADRHLHSFVSFLRTYAGMVHLLLKSARKSKFLVRNGDMRFIALNLLQQHCALHPDVKGARNQAVLVAAALFLGAKFCDQNAQIRHVLCETGLANLTVKAADVYDAEWSLLKACNYHIQIPRFWQAACEVALSSPHEGMGLKGSLAPQTRLRIQHTAMYLDRQLVELSRSQGLQLAVLQMNADELALGCSVAVAAAMATPTEATVALFDSVVVAPLNINFQTLQAEALHEYVKCLAHLAGVLVAEVTASN